MVCAHIRVVFVYCCMVCGVYRYKYSVLWMSEWYLGMWCDKQCMVYVEVARERVNTV